MTWTPCPESVSQEHGAANTSGKCPYCGEHLGRPRLRQRPTVRDDVLHPQLSRRQRLDLDRARLDDHLDALGIDDD